MLAPLFAWMQAHLTLSAFAGVAATAGGALIKKAWDRRSERIRSRDALYAEMAENFVRLIFLASPRSPIAPFERRHPGYQEKIGLHGISFLFNLYHDIRSKPVFREIAGASSIEDFYAWLNRIVNPLPSDDVIVLIREAVEWTAVQAHDGRLDGPLLARKAPEFARADIRRITSESREWLYQNWLSFGATGGKSLPPAP
jgi:hypothetical protein